MIIKIAKEYTETPGPRYIKEGKFSGEDFRINILEPKYKEALDNNEKLIIDFDGGYGYGTSFLEESFGGLARKGYDPQQMIETMEFISNEEPIVIEKVNSYIKVYIKDEQNR